MPDFQGDLDAVRTVMASPIDILNHNVETVPRLYKRVRPGAKYDRSLALLAAARSAREDCLTKAGMMLGLGETSAEIDRVFEDLRDVALRHPDAWPVSQAVAGASSGRAISTPPEEFTALRDGRSPLDSATSRRARWCAVRITLGRTFRKKLGKNDDFLRRGTLRLRGFWHTVRRV